jgi:hypothetical protein
MLDGRWDEPVCWLRENQARSGIVPVMEAADLRCMRLRPSPSPNLTLFSRDDRKQNMRRMGMRMFAMESGDCSVHSP